MFGVQGFGCKVKVSCAVISRVMSSQLRVCLVLVSAGLLRTSE